jgi:hypothetical protein
MQLQLEVFNIKVCYYIRFYHDLHQLHVWRVYRSGTYWAWLQRVLLKFVNCVQTLRPPTPADIPIVCYDSLELAKSGYDFSRVDPKVPRKHFPPKVYYEPVGVYCTLQADEKDKISTFMILSAVLILAMVLLLYSM